MFSDSHDNPYQSFGSYDPDSPMASEPGVDEGPPPTAPRVIGVLNIVFGLLLGICGLCQGVSIVSQTAMGPQMQGGFQEAIDDEIDTLSNEIDTLQQELESASDDAEVAELERQIAERETQVEALRAMPNMMAMWGLDDKRVAAFVIGQCVVALLLNLLLFISGIGLLNYAEWGRRMGVWTAALKLVNLVVLLVLILVVVAPAMAEGMADLMEQVEAQQNRGGAPAPAPQDVAAGMRMGISIWAGVYVALAAIYPAICLWQLNRTRVKRACQTTSETDQFSAA